MQMSSHAYDQAVSRNISEEDINHAITHGSRWRCNRDPAIHYARLNGTFVVMHGRGLWVLTAYHLED